jgi:hypothetical protein
LSVEYIDTGAMDWTEVTKDWPGMVQAGEPAVRFKPFEVASGAVPRGHLVEYEPGHFEKPHSHEESEILFIIDGDATIGGEPVRSRMLVYVPGGTTYGPIEGGAKGIALSEAPSKGQQAVT